MATASIGGATKAKGLLRRRAVHAGSEVEEQGIGLEEGVGADDAPDALPPERCRGGEHRKVARIDVHRGHRTTAAAANAISPTTATAAAAAAMRLFSPQAKGGGGQAVREPNGSGVDPQSSIVRKPLAEAPSTCLGGGGGCYGRRRPTRC